MDGSRARARYIPALDGVRGIAIILVIMCHVNWAFGGPFMPGRINGPVATMFGWGWIGVDLFFVLSGFLITGILFDAKGYERYFLNFYARRTLRIFPLYFGFLLVAIVLLPQLPFAFCERLSISGPDAASLGLYYYNFRVGVTGQALGSLHHFWSLALEEHFYLVWPLAIWALSRRSLMRLCVAATVISFLLRVALVLGTTKPMLAFFATPCRLDGLLAGAFVALAWRNNADWAALQRWAGRVATGSGFLLLGLALGQRHFIPDVDLSKHNVAVDATLLLTVGLAALAVFFAALIVLAMNAAQGSNLRRFLEGRILVVVGKYSYAIYVFHALILLATVHFTGPLSEIPLFIVKPAMVLWVLTTSLLAAWLSFHLYEKHFLGLKRFFEYREASLSTKIVSSHSESFSNAAPEPVRAL
ncbi:MAG: acyltransferase [Planctomycetes bacterium]|nr:acyltransferase [Planctomycetota bacterium]